VGRTADFNQPPLKTASARTSRFESQTWLSPAWQSKARRTIDQSTKHMTVPVDNLGMKYLQGRAIQAEIVASFNIGFDLWRFDPISKEKRPAIVIPWQDARNVVCAVKFRFCDELSKREKGRRFTQMSGSCQVLFGLHLCTGGGPTKTLVAVEGELNAMSIWQVTSKDRFDVISVGPENNPTALQGLDSLIRDHRYRRVLLWFDTAERACDAGDMLALHKPRLMRSPFQLDANDILRTNGPEGLRELLLSHLDKQPEGHSGMRPPLHIVAQGVRISTHDVQKACAWREWVNDFGRRPDAPNLSTVDECIRYVIDLWNECTVRARTQRPGP